MEGNSSIPHDSSLPLSVIGPPKLLSDGVVKLLGVTDAFGVSFGFYLEAVSSDSMFSKKTPKGMFHGPASGFFSQRKKASLGNIKHSDNKKDISLKSGSGACVYSNVESLSGDDEDVSMSDGFNGSLLDSAVNTPKTKRVNTGANFGSPIGSLDFKMDEEVKFFLLPLKKKVPLDKIWIDPKIIKTPVEIKFFSKINGFGGATTPSKFERIIRSMFTSEDSIKKAILLAGENGINVNSNLKKQGIRSDWAVVIKEIPMDMPKNMIIATVSEFGQIKSIKIQLIGMWQKAVVEFAKLRQADLLASKWSFLIRKDSVHVAKTVRDRDTWALKNQFRALLFTLPVETTVHNLNTLLDGAVSLDSSSGGFSFGSHLLSGGLPLSLGSFGSQVDGLGNCLAVLKCSLEILSDQVSVILKKLSFIELVPLASLPCASPLAVFVPLAPVVDLDMTLNGMLASPAPPFLSSGEFVDGLSSSGSKVLTSKMGSLKFKMSALEALFSSIMGVNVPAKQADIVYWHMNSGNMIKDKFDGIRIFTSGLDIGYLGAGIAVIMNTSLACYVSRVEEVSGHLISIWLLFKDKLSVTILNLYADTSPGTRFAQASAVNSLIVKAVNSSTFVVLSGDFNKNDSGRSANFKFCLGLDLVNLGVEKTIDFIFVSGILSSAVVKHCVNSVSDFFDMDHKSVMVSVGLDGFLDVQLNGLHKQTNRDCWKFRIKDVDSAGWSRFKECSSAKMLEVKERFLDTAAGLDLDAMWSLLEKVMVNSADKIFSRHWFCDFQCSKNKHSSKFLGLELLAAKIVKCLTSADAFGFNHFVRKWLALDAGKALVLEDIVYGGQKVENLLSYLLLVRKEYRKSKMFESKLLQEATIRKAIKKRMKQFCLDKRSMIRSVVLDHLVVDNKLILELEEKHVMPMVLSDLWAHQYAPLNYVRNDAFSDVISVINMDKLLSVTNELPDGKAAGLSDILNEFWKHGCGEVLKCLLVLLNMCLSVGMVPALWKKTWVLMIPKPYDWDGTARKILFKILSDRISLACSTSTQFPVFVVGLVVEDALEKNREIWLVLQDIASLQHIKMCKRFIGFFGNIYEDRINRVMTDFGLSNDYSVHDGLDQSERIFYNLLLCEVKRHKHLCGYHVDSKFVVKTDRVESVGEMMSYLAAGVFVDDTIWIGNCQTSIQYTLYITSEFFKINDISINNDKTMTIPINQGVKIAFLSICGWPILIAKKGEAHYYLSIFLSTEGLSKPSVSKAHSDVCFFVNVMLRKAIMNKQLNLDVMVRKSLKFKAGLPHDFLDAALYYPFLYGLKTFEQMQSEGKIAALVSFSNASGVLGHLFDYRFLDLQVLGWAPLNPLQFPVKLHVSPVNNFLAGIAKIFLSNELSLANNLFNAFHSSDHFPLSSILGSSKYFDPVCFLKHFGVAFGDWLLDKKGHRLDPWGPVPYWFSVASKFLLVQGFSASSSADGLHDIWSSCFEMYTDGSLRNAGSVDAACGTAAYFLVLDKSVRVVVGGLLSSTLVELQAVVLALELILHTDSQAAIDVCLSELSCAIFDFHNWCWLERCHLEVMAISGNACHFEAGPGMDVVPNNLVGCAVYRHLPVAVQKRLYDKGYPGILCLLCGKDVVVHNEILVEAFVYWVLVVDLCDSSSSAVLRTLSACSLDVGLYSIVCKGFMLNKWCEEAQGVFDDKKQAIGKVVNFVRFIANLHCVKTWLVKSEHRVQMEKAGLVADSSVVFGLSHNVFSILLGKVVRMLDVIDLFAVSFGYCLPCCFFSSLGSVVSVNIGV
ncbi:hypothetical protein G9A89_018067 [Geosiphon pyriformis]|nr:hypothetical protein G9A89_018067 [Geosiphon pyriformis]